MRVLRSKKQTRSSSPSFLFITLKTPISRAYFPLYYGEAVEIFFQLQKHRFINKTPIEPRFRKTLIHVQTYMRDLFRTFGTTQKPKGK